MPRVSGVCCSTSGRVARLDTSSVAASLVPSATRRWRASRRALAAAAAEPERPRHGQRRPGGAFHDVTPLKPVTTSEEGLERWRQTLDVERPPDLVAFAVDPRGRVTPLDCCPDAPPSPWMSPPSPTPSASSPSPSSPPSSPLPSDIVPPAAAKRWGDAAATAAFPPDAPHPDGPSPPPLDPSDPSLFGVSSPRPPSPPGSGSGPRPTEGASPGWSAAAAPAVWPSGPRGSTRPVGAPGGGRAAARLAAGGLVDMDALAAAGTACTHPREDRLVASVVDSAPPGVASAASAAAAAAGPSPSASPSARPAAPLLRNEDCPASPADAAAPPGTLAASEYAAVDASFPFDRSIRLLGPETAWRPRPGHVDGPELWAALRAEAQRESEREPALASHLYMTVLSKPRRGGGGGAPRRGRLRPLPRLAPGAGARDLPPPRSSPVWNAPWPTSSPPSWATRRSAPSTC